MSQPHVLLTVRDRRAKLLEAVQESPQVRCYTCNEPHHVQLRTRSPSRGTREGWDNAG